MSENNKTVTYLEEKKELVVSASVQELMQILNEISLKDVRPKINNEVLSNFVPPKYRNSKNNAQKFGEETKEYYCKAIRGEVEGTAVINNERYTMQDGALQIFWHKVFSWWCVSNVELDTLGKLPIVENPNLINYEQLFKNAINSNVSRETLTTLYKFSPTIPINKEYEEKITKAPFRLALFNRAHDKDDSEEKLTKANERIEELESKLEQYSDYEEIKKQLNQKEEECERIKKENEDLDDKLTDYTSDILDFEAKCENMVNKIKDLEIENDKLKYNNEYERKYNNLLNKYEELANKKSFSGDAEKMKNHFEEQLIEKDNIIRALEKDKEDLIESNKEIISLQNENSKLKRRETGIIRDLKSLILGNKDFQKKFKRIILEDKPICEFIVRNIPDLKSGVELEVAARREQREITREQKKVITSNLNSNNIIEKIKVNYDDLKTHYEKFCTDNGIVPISDLWNKIQSGTFFIFEEDSLIKLLKNSNYDIDIKRISVEPNWHDMEDWFGKFDDGVFIPSKTEIADFYIDKKENPNKLGILVFDNFNIIPPEIYIKYFIEDIENNGEFWVVDINTPIVEGYKFMSVEQLSNLKYFFIKSKDPDTSFKIPKDLLKYELTGVN